MVVNLFFLKSFCKVSIAFVALVGALFAVYPFDAYAKDSPANHVQTSSARKLTVRAMQSIEQGSDSFAKSLVVQSKDSLAYKLYDWMTFTTMKNPSWDIELFLKLTKFVRQNPEWPSISKIILLAENVMPQNLSNEEVIVWFDDYAPKTSMGMSRYMDAMIINGKKDAARKFLAQWWAGASTSRDQQKEIYQKYGQYLTMEAHKKRFDSLLLNGDFSNARAMAGVLGNGYAELAEARIALAQDQGGNVEGLIARVPGHLQNDAGLLYERLHWRRNRDLDQAAIEILRRQPSPDKIANQDDWWMERHIIIRRLMERKDYDGAYALAREHSAEDGLSYAQAQWLAGWLALRYMNKPTQAFERFSVMYNKVATPISQSRAAYWAGRAAKALGDNKLAQDWYKKAAAFKTTFYGQLALAELSVQPDLPKDTVLNLSDSDRGSFAKNELIQAAHIFHAAGMTTTSSRFLNAFIDQQKSPKAYKYAAETSMDLGNRNEALRIAKNASASGFFMAKQAYPTATEWVKNTNNVEMALVHSLIRQESMFDVEALSHAGARGLMQLMPGTAKEVSGKLGVAYSLDGLTKRPDYNVMLGSAYVARLLSRYDGNYPLAIAAYNAGPGRVDKWIKIYGDPRDKSVDLVDWIELIPIYETRNYVQRVLENVYVYRLRLKGIQQQPKNAVHVAFQ